MAVLLEYGRDLLKISIINILSLVWTLTYAAYLQIIPGFNQRNRREIRLKLWQT
jgi:hypothetical protein